MKHCRPRPINVGTSLSIITDAQILEEIEADFSTERPEIKVEGTRKRKERERKCVNGLVMPVGLSPVKMVPIPLFREIKEDRVCKKQRPFEFPPKYITYDEPTPDEEEHIVEYDMDSDDESFLSTLNKQSTLSKAKHLACLKEQEFETLFDLFEKTHQKIKEGNTETFSEVIAHLFRVVRVDDMEDMTCSVCNDGEFTDDNLIIFCDGCNTGVHQHCYGLKTVPPDEFYCDRCRYMIDLDQAKLISGKITHTPSVRCEFCPVSTGAFKPLMYLDKNGKQAPRWAHVTCAMWIAECSFADTETLDPIFAMQVPSRNKHTCCVCNRKNGVCVKCSEKDCHEYFHVMCGRTREFSIYARPAIVKQEKTEIPKKTNKTKQERDRDYNDNPIEGDKVEFVQYCAAHSLKSEIQRTDSHFGFSKLTEEELGELDVFVTSSRGLALPAYSTELVYWYWRWRRKHHKGSFLRKFQALTPLAAFLEQHQTTVPECIERLRSMRQQFETLRIMLDMVKKREHLKKELIETRVGTVDMEVKRLNEFIEWWNSPRRSPRKKPDFAFYEQDEEEEELENESQQEQEEQLEDQTQQQEQCPLQEGENEYDEENSHQEEEMELEEVEQVQPELVHEEYQEHHHEIEPQEEGEDGGQPELVNEPVLLDPQQEERGEEENIEIDILDHEEVDSNVSSGGELEAPAPEGSLPATPTRNTRDSDSDVSGAEESFDSFDLELPIKFFEEHKQRLSKLDSIKNGFMRGGTIDEPIVIDDTEERPKKRKKEHNIRETPKKRRKKRKTVLFERKKVYTVK